MRRVLFIAAVVTVAGCASIDTSPLGNGRYMRGISAGGEVIAQVDLPSTQACRAYASNARSAMAQQKSDGSRIECSELDVAEKMNYRGTFEDQADGATWVVTTKTQLACDQIAAGFMRTKVSDLNRSRFTQSSECRPKN